MSNPAGGKLPDIKHGERKIDKAQLEFMKLIEEQNLERVTKLKRVKRNNLLTAGALITSVVGIYAYSIWSVKQEKFLDDFEEPKKVNAN